MADGSGSPPGSEHLPSWPETQSRLIGRLSGSEAWGRSPGMRVDPGGAWPDCTLAGGAPGPMENSQAILGPGAVLSPALSPSLGACQGGSGLGLHLLELVELGGHSDQDHLFKTPSSTAYLPLFFKGIFLLES